MFFLPPFLSLPSHSLRDFTQGPVNMYNCSVVTVSGSIFENNHAQSVFTDLPSRVSGGGLSITIHGKSNSSVTQGKYNYTIQNCTFSNNSANSTASTAGTISILEGGYVNNRGGGVSFYIVHPSEVEIKVLHSNFTNNFAPLYGGGLYVFSPHLVTGKYFTIAGNHFEGNEARTGGGIKVTLALFQQSDREVYLNTSVLTESVIIHRNTFRQNRANNNGGAMYLGPGEQAVSQSLPQCLQV